MKMEHMMVAQDEFTRAKARARRSKLFSLIRGRSDDLLSFADVKKTVRTEGESYIGCRTIPIGQIVGSEDRTADFNKDFNPRRDFMKHRWVSVDSAFYEGVTLPPVRLMELDGQYFVRDGHHRISVAKMHRVGYIDAEITRIDTKVIPFTTEFSSEPATGRKTDGANKAAA